MNELQKRLEGIQKILMGTYEAGIPLSSHSNPLYSSRREDVVANVA